MFPYFLKNKVSQIERRPVRTVSLHGAPTVSSKVSLTFPVGRPVKLYESFDKKTLIPLFDLKKYRLELFIVPNKENRDVKWV